MPFTFPGCHRDRPSFLTRLLFVSGVLFQEYLVLHYNHEYDEHGTVDISIHDLPVSAFRSRRFHFKTAVMTGLGRVFRADRDKLAV